MSVGEPTFTADRSYTGAHALDTSETVIQMQETDPKTASPVKFRIWNESQPFNALTLSDSEALARARGSVGREHRDHQIAPLQRAGNRAARRSYQ